MIGGFTYTLASLNAAWKRLADVPVALEGRGDVLLDGPFLKFPAGVPVSEVWQWFEDQHPRFSVAHAQMGLFEADDPDEVGDDFRGKVSEYLVSRGVYGFYFAHEGAKGWEIRIDSSDSALCDALSDACLDCEISRGGGGIAGGIYRQVDFANFSHPTDRARHLLDHFETHGEPPPPSHVRLGVSPDGSLLAASGAVAHVADSRSCELAAWLEARAEESWCYTCNEMSWGDSVQVLHLLAAVDGEGLMGELGKYACAAAAEEEGVCSPDGEVASWSDVCVSQGWSESTQVMHLEGFIRTNRFMAVLASLAERAADEERAEIEVAAA